MDLEALPDIASFSPMRIGIEHLPPFPSKVHAAILANILVSPQHGALQSDPDQASDQIGRAFGVRELDGPHVVIPSAFRPFLAHLLQDLFHVAPFLAKALGDRAFEMTPLTELAGNKMPWLRSIGPLRLGLERANPEHRSIAEHQKAFLGTLEYESPLRRDGLKEPV